MADYWKFLNETFVKKPLLILLGGVYCILMLVFLVLSVPVYVFRQVVIILVKLSRPDFGDIINGQSAIFVGDYMAETPPRSNLVHIMVFEGQLTLEELRRRVLKRWIAQNDIFDNFQSYPVKWLGFTFWKNASRTFLIENHVHMHSGKDIEISDQKLDEIAETLFNEKFSKFQSPWELHLIENYQYPYSEAKSNNQLHSALILKWHHCLMDGVGEMTALMDGLFEKRWIRQPEAPRPKRSLWQAFLYNFTFPAKAFFETSYIFSHTFRKDPYKIPDEMKEWHQITAKSVPIPIQVIKNIKNSFGVSYTSVLLSAMSAALYKTENNGSSTLKNKSTLCLSVMPPTGKVKRKVLENHMTGAVFDLPTVRFEDPIDRLRRVNRLFENNKRSVIPRLAEYYTSFVGAHSYFFNRLLTKNRMIPIGLTNFAAVPKNIEITEKLKWIESWVFAGAHFGIAGLGVMVISHGQKVCFHVCVEKALMSGMQAEEFIRSITEEIELLQNLTL